MNPADYRKELTEKIIHQLEAGTAPWIRPWNPEMGMTGVPHNAVSGRHYRGGNQLWLDCQGYADPRWCTFKQAKEQGWQIRRGEKASVVEYWQWTEKKRDDQGIEVEAKLEQPRVFYAHVFNTRQMENVPEFQTKPLEWEPEAAAERILKASGADIRQDQSKSAFYSPHNDSIHLPPKFTFQNAAGFYATALHELGHWTGHASRLNRDLVNGFGTPDYAREELRAELSSYFLSSRLGIPHEPGQHAAYIGSWIDALRKDHNEIHRASRDAERIVEFILEYQKEKINEAVVEKTTKPAIPAAIAKYLSRQSRPVKQAESELEMEC